MKRSGMTLIEMLVSMGLAGVVLTVVATLLAALWRADAKMRADIDARQSLARLELALRSDCQAAVAAEVDAGGMLTLAAGDQGRITYSTDGRRVDRLVMAEDRIDHRESFRLPRESGVQFRVEERIVRLTLQPIEQTAADAPSRVSATIEAVIAAGKEDQP